MTTNNGSPIVIRRRAVGTAGSVIGAAALVIAIVALLWTGEFASYVIVSLMVSAAGFILWAYMTPREFIGFFTGRSARFSTVATFSTLLLIGIVALVYLQLTRVALTFDATQASLYTLSSESERVLSRIARPIRILGFYSSRALPLRETDDQFFRLYETQTNGLITREYIDPDQQPAMAQRFGVTFDGQVFVGFLNADGSLDLSTVAYVPLGSAQERDMTRAIARLLIAGRLSVYFDVGLGERNPIDTTQEGLSSIVGGVAESGIVPQTLNLAEIAAQNGEIPADASAVIFTRPTRDLTPQEIQVVDRYLNRGGSLLLMPDVLFNETPFMVQNGEFNQYLWNTYGIGAFDAAVVEQNRERSQQTPLDVIAANIFTESPIASRLDPNVNPTLFSLARMVDVKLEDTPANIANGRLIFTTDQGYGETNLQALGDTNTYQYDEGADYPGPITTAAWSTNLSTEAKIVLIGDGDFVANGRILTADGQVAVQGNGILFTDALVWLTEFDSEIDFQPQMFNQTVPLIFISEGQFNGIAFITVIFMPVAVLLIGGAIWLRRSRR